MINNSYCSLAEHSLLYYRSWLTDRGFSCMVERRVELRRRYSRKKKMRKLKGKLAEASNPQERERILYKIHRLSPWWEEPKEEEGGEE